MIYLLVEKYTDYGVLSPIRLAAENAYDAHEETFKRFEGVLPEKVEWFKVYELDDEGELTLRSTFRRERADVVDADELEELLQPAGNL